MSISRQRPAHGSLISSFDCWQDRKRINPNSPNCTSGTTESRGKCSSCSPTPAQIVWSAAIVTAPHQPGSSATGAKSPLVRHRRKSSVCGGSGLSSDRQVSTPPSAATRIGQPGTGYAAISRKSGREKMCKQPSSQPQTITWQSTTTQSHGRIPAGDVTSG